MYFDAVCKQVTLGTTGYVTAFSTGGTGYSVTDL